MGSRFRLAVGVILSSRSDAVWVLLNPVQLPPGLSAPTWPGSGGETRRGSGFCVRADIVPQLDLVLFVSWLTQGQLEDEVRNTENDQGFCSA